MKEVIASETRISTTTLWNRLSSSIKGDIFDLAIDLGCDKKCIIKHKYNMVEFIEEFIIPESYFYPSIKNGIEKLWNAEDYDSSKFYIEDTSGKDSKIEGPWTRPDFTLVSYRKFSWTIGDEFDVVTFEVKRPDNCNVLAVFEALAHATVATRAYVVFPINDQDWERTAPKQRRRVIEECTRHGVGLILIEDIYNEIFPNHFIRARRREIDHEKCSSFLSAVMPLKGKDKIAQWK